MLIPKAFSTDDLPSSIALSKTPTLLSKLSTPGARPFGASSAGNAGCARKNKLTTHAPTLNPLFILLNLLIRETDFDD
jgi:hypothetical protein